jgi:hypothetical protein
MKLSHTLMAVALLSSAAFAQDAPQGPAATPKASPNTATQPPAAAPAGPAVDIGAIFDKLDTNHDGKLSPEEAQAHPTVASHFSSADANGDGFVSKDEFMAAFKPQQ